MKKNVVLLKKKVFNIYKSERSVNGIKPKFRVYIHSRFIRK